MCIIERSGIEYEFMKRNIKPINESRGKGGREENRERFYSRGDPNRKTRENPFY